MNYLKSILSILAGIYLITYWGYAQTGSSQQKSIISAKIVALSFEKQKDTLRMPVVDDKYPALKAALSYKNIFDGDDLPDVIKNYQSCGCGIISLDYEVTYENKDIISIVLYFNTIGAYPDDYQKFLTFNISTGKMYPLSNEINPQGLNWIFTNYKTLMRKRVFNEKKDDAEYADAYSELKTTLDSLKDDELFGKYVFIKRGILLSIEKILPHAMQAIEPNRDWIIPYDKLKAYKTPGAVVLK